MKIIGITGPTGAGKTTALHVLEELGGRVIDCDRVYHSLLDSSVPLREALRARFGGGVFAQDGSLNRKALGQLVFQDEAAMRDLNAITHSFVADAVGRELAQAKADRVPAAAIDAIALIESGLGRLCHCTVAVTAPEEARVRRIMAREGISEEYARLRVSAQKKAEWFGANCTYVLYNDCDGPEAFRDRARALLADVLADVDKG